MMGYFICGALVGATVTLIAMTLLITGGGLMEVERCRRLADR